MAMSLDDGAGGEIRRAISAAGGAIPFERFMQLALYGDGGFYTSELDDPADGRGGDRRPSAASITGVAGRRGDFITSPEVGPLFGAVLARLLDAEWRRLDEPDPFTVIDLGAGPGTLARSIITAEPECLAAIDYVAVEVSPRQRVRHPEAVRSVESIDAAVPPHATVAGVVIANEVLDNVPFRLAVFDDGWREAFVVARDDGTFAETLSEPFEPLPSALPRHAEHGARAPLQDGAARLLQTVLDRLSAGSVHVFDYCRPATALLAGLPWRSWLRTYRGHERGDHYLTAPGTQDITVDIAVDQLPEPDGVRTQAQFLQRWGIDDFVDEGRRAWTAAASRPTLEAIRMRSRISEAEALLDPNGLGAFTVLEYRR